MLATAQSSNSYPVAAGEDDFLALERTLQRPVRSPRLTAPALLAGRFEVLRCLGEGGLAAVYSARDRRLAARGARDPLLAVKVVRDQHLMDQRVLLAFQREVAVLAKLEHPNIARLYHFYQHPPWYFVCMELLPGGSLAALSGHPLRSAERCQQYIADIASALAHAHQRGIVHGDIKTKNVLLDAAGQVKLVDFSTSPELAAWTEAYASVARLAGEPPCPADDVYALGVMACELLGGHPFGGLAADQARACGLPPQRPPGLSRRQWQAIAGALELDGVARWQNAAEFAAEFGA